MIRCPSCSCESELVFDKIVNSDIDIRIYTCTKCKLTFDDSQIEEYILLKYISEQYYQKKDVGYAIDSRFIRHFNRRANNHIKFINNYFPKDFKGNVLDVGCGGGMFLQKMKTIGWQAFGIEPSEQHYQYATNQLNLSVFKGLFHEYNTDNKFDLIYFSHVFDDLPQFKKTFYQINNILDYKGIIFIEVPNYNRDKNFKLVQDGDFIENKYYFTMESLELVFKQNGFKVDYLKTYESIYLNSWQDYLKAPYQIMKTLFIPEVNKEQIRLIATK